jgi:hypothetical protein
MSMRRSWLKMPSVFWRKNEMEPKVLEEIGKHYKQEVIEFD